MADFSKSPSARKSDSEPDSAVRKSPRKSKTKLPKKPYPEFPLGPGPSGHWQKRIKKRLCYFGAWGRRVNGKLEILPNGGEWEKALALYKARAEDLYAGRVPQTRESNNAASNNDELTLKELCNAFLTAKLKRVGLKVRGITQRTFSELRHATDTLIAHFGGEKRIADIRPEDWSNFSVDLSKKWGPVRVGTVIVRIKSVFNWGTKNGRIEKRVIFGDDFDKPSADELQKEKNRRPKKLFSAAEIYSLLNGASPQLRAMILLGINAALGNNDLAGLPISSLDLDDGWVKYPRPKTGAPRRCKLWPETVAALREVIANRSEPKDEADSDIVFLTSFGVRWVRMKLKEEIDGIPFYTAIDGIVPEFTKLLKRLDIKRDGVGFYSLRHTFRTRVDSCLDHTAIRFVMGHKEKKIDGTYIEDVEDERLQAVSAHVHNWLFGLNGGEK